MAFIQMFQKLQNFHFRENDGSPLSLNFGAFGDNKKEPTRRAPYQL